MSKENKKTTPSSPSDVGIALTAFSGPVQIANAAVCAFINAAPSVTAREVFDQHREIADIGCGIPVRFSYTLTGALGDLRVEHAALLLQEKAGNKNTSTYVLAPSRDEISVYNLKGGTEYEYTISVTLSDGSTKTAAGDFVTASMPRLIRVDGIYNVRDIGGWRTTDGKVIRQGLLYRGTEGDGAVEPDFKLTEKGIKTMRDELKIAYDMDLREPFATDDDHRPLGEDIPHVYYAQVNYADIFGELGKERMKRVFSDLAKEENYPIYIHCSYGNDRTGTVCYMLEAILGVSADDLVREYEISNLFEPSLHRKNILKVYDGLQDYAGDTVKEKAENYLLSCGVTPSQIEDLRNIFLSARPCIS